MKTNNQIDMLNVYAGQKMQLRVRKGVCKNISS
jgi:hypothetical protein